MTGNKTFIQGESYLRLGYSVVGRFIRTCYHGGQKTVIAVVFVFLCAAGGTWLFGLRLGWLAVGAYVGMALDECGRAVFMYLRWNKGIWRTKNLVTEN